METIDFILGYYSGTLVMGVLWILITREQKKT